MPPTVRDWTSLLDDAFPPSWAEPWDNPGLQVGGADWPADRVVVALDPAPEVVAEGRELGAGLIVTHHPLVFRPLARLDEGDATARIALEAARAGIAVFACHTNADVAGGGVSDALAEALDLEVTGVLEATAAGERVKLVTFVPPEATAKVLDAVAGAGGGVIGEYTHCSFRVRGSGTFLPSERAQPVVGERGELNEAEEDRLEIVVPRERLSTATRAMIEAHPYEEVAYDAYQLVGGGLGLGRVTRLREPVTGDELAGRCAERLGASVRVAGPRDRPVERVAVCGGSGGSLVAAAIRCGADAYVTGDVKHHEALDARAAGLTVIDAGHHATEWPFVPRLAALLSDRGEGLGSVEISNVSTDPFAQR
ncbi:MAG TPA: Nif3-like dinuclear metal center hexameric protein [Actinomycetota bacterium]|nr:Nif3-like dinuclear metal center hexameric protein [Actinomycetota bacterium]